MPMTVAPLSWPKNRGVVLHNRGVGVQQGGPTKFFGKQAKNLFGGFAAMKNPLPEGGGYNRGWGWYCFFASLPQQKISKNWEMLSLKNNHSWQPEQGREEKPPIFACFFDLNVVLFLQRCRTVFSFYFCLPGKILAKWVTIPTPISIFLWETLLIFF